MNKRRAAQLDREIADALSRRRAHARKRPRPYIPDGRAKGRHPSEFDPEQLRVGAKHEMEHTTSKRLARQIAMDHLVEDPLYYVKLARVHLD